MMKLATGIYALVLGTSSAALGQSFVNWESPHGTPLDLTPDGSTLLAVNTPDNRLEVFTVTGSGLSHVGAIPVGLDPVSVRARTDTEVWVVNLTSDTVSIVDLASFNVVHTIYAGDEPVDVIFAGSPERAFVSVSQLNQVKVYDPANPSAAPVVLDIEGEDPRVMAKDGSTVYVAIFESGNNTTILSQPVVSSGVNPYPGNQNPPPNDGTDFDPPIAGGLPTPPEVSLIVKKDELGAWLDDNSGDWSAAVGWDLRDQDVAIIDANGLSVSYTTGLMNANMALSVAPGGDVVVVGTDCINEIRFEPNVAGIFVRVLAASLSGPGSADAIVDLNPHLDYSTPQVPQATRDLSIGDPRGIAWRSTGPRGFITGMGSNNVVVVDGSLNRIGLVEVGEGPTGAVYDSVNDRVYVANKFEGSISVLDAAGLLEESRIGFYDPTPVDIRDGRPFLYDTHRTSGLGQASCASCHVDGRMDQVAWDLGDPSGSVKTFNQVCNFGLGGCEDWHPMKGPMTTQTLIGIIGTEPFHWRADREDLAAFNPAFESLLGDDTQLTTEEMNQYIAFVATLTPPPNPFRHLDGSLATQMELPPATGAPDFGNAQTGESLFNTATLDFIDCVTCHALPAGTNGQLTSANLLGETQSIKIPQLRNMHEKTGFDAALTDNNRGFGFIHDGSTPTMFDFLNFPAFQFSNHQERRDVEAFLMSFATETHAGVGAQVTIPQPVGAAYGPELQELLDIAAAGGTGLVVKGVVSGEQRGYAFIGSGTYQSDRAAEIVDEATLLAAAGAGSELTFTLVPAGSETRIGIDRDEDGFFDSDELDAGSNPADPDSTPDNVVEGDVNGDGQVDVSDLLIVLGEWGACPDPPAPCPGDIDGDGQVGVTDLLIVLANWS